MCLDSYHQAMTCLGCLLMYFALQGPLVCARADQKSFVWPSIKQTSFDSHCWYLHAASCKAMNCFGCLLRGLCRQKGWSDTFCIRAGQIPFAWPSIKQTSFDSHHYILHATSLTAMNRIDALPSKKQRCDLRQSSQSQLSALMIDGGGASSPISIMSLMERHNPDAATFISDPHGCHDHHLHRL